MVRFHKAGKVIHFVSICLCVELFIKILTRHPIDELYGPPLTIPLRTQYDQADPKKIHVYQAVLTKFQLFLLTWETSITSKSTSMTATDQMLTREVEMLSSIRMNTPTIAHRFGGPEGPA